MSVTSPAGFVAAGVAAGLKESGDLDVAVVHNLGPEYAAAGVFTSNRVVAAPVVWSQAAVADGQLRAVVLNSGGANACTGERGAAAAQQMAQLTAEHLDYAASDVAVCSTGLIGVHLPLPRVAAGIAEAAQSMSVDGGDRAAWAILTTDSHAKTASFRHPDGWTIGGMAKGAGMLAPALATMLVVLTTDAHVDDPDAALRQATAQTFDRLDSDGCMSTNDTVLLLANGASSRGPSPDVFAAALTSVCHDLAMQLLQDAEGAHHDISIRVSGAATEADALTVGRAVARSNLFKCAIFGNDPNWGRVLAQVGTTAAAFDPADLAVAFNGITVFAAGAPAADRSLVDLTPRRAEIDIDLGAGAAQATIWTSDLTYDYVRENAEYAT